MTKLLDIRNILQQISGTVERCKTQLTGGGGDRTSGSD